MALPRNAMTGLYDEVICNVWDVTTKIIVFTGNQSACGAFLGVPPGDIACSIRRKARIKKKYTIRRAKIIKP